MKLTPPENERLTCEKGEGARALYTAWRDGRALGCIAVDSTMMGRACGGLRMLPDVSADEVRALARAMTLKYGFLGLPQGGAKAGILGDPEASQEKRYALLADFGRIIAPLLKSRAYTPGSDMGTDSASIRHMLCAAGMRVGPHDLRDNASGYYTAVSTIACVLACASRAGIDLRRATAAVEGFGHVGNSMATLLSRAGVKVVAISTTRGALYNPDGLDIARLAALADQAGSRVVELYTEAESIKIKDVVELPVDILCPCARNYSIREDNVSRLSAKIVCAGANNPMTSEAERVLTTRGVRWLPDFLSNSGGVLGGTMEFASIEPDQIESFILEHIGAAACAILDETDRTGSPPRQLAENIALERFASVKKAAEHPTIRGRAMNLGLELYHRGIIPPSLVRGPALGYFRKLFQRRIP
jgi:glutamate dehydrogenase (NAD(P)+)